MSRPIVLASLLVAAASAAGICPTAIPQIDSVSIAITDTNTSITTAAVPHAFSLTNATSQGMTFGDSNGCSAGATFVTEYTVSNEDSTTVTGCAYTAATSLGGVPTDKGCTYTYTTGSNTIDVVVTCDPTATTGLQVSTEATVTATGASTRYAYAAIIASVCGDATTTATSTTTTTTETTTTVTSETTTTTSDVTVITTDDTTTTGTPGNTTAETTTEATTTTVLPTTTTAPPTTVAAFTTVLWEAEIVAAIKEAINVTAAPSVPLLRAAHFAADASITASCNHTDGMGTNHTCDVTFADRSEAVAAVDAANKGAMVGVYGGEIITPLPTTAAPAGEEDDSEENAVGMAIGITAGVVVIAAIFGGLYALYVKKTRLSKYDDARYDRMASDLVSLNGKN